MRAYVPPPNHVYVLTTEHGVVCAKDVFIREPDARREQGKHPVGTQVQRLSLRFPATLLRTHEEQEAAQ